MAWIFVGLLCVPVVEAVVIIKLADSVGWFDALMLIFVTGVIGITMARTQGFVVVQQIRKDVAAGRMPAPRIMDGVMILLAGALLVTPGLITDFVGFTLLIPGVRHLIRMWMRARVEKWITEGRPNIKVRRF
jgi:UPF0716 protein FxsA